MAGGLAGKVLGRTQIGIVVTGQLLPVGLPPPRVYTGGHVAVGHVVCRLSVRSTDASVIEPISVDPARFIEELFGRTMVEGINAGTSYPEPELLIYMQCLYLTVPPTRTCNL